MLLDAFLEAPGRRTEIRRKKKVSMWLRAKRNGSDPFPKGLLSVTAQIKEGKIELNVSVNGQCLYTGSLEP